MKLTMTRRHGEHGPHACAQSGSRDPVAPRCSVAHSSSAPSGDSTFVSASSAPLPELGAAACATSPSTPSSAGTDASVRRAHKERRTIIVRLDTSVPTRLLQHYIMHVLLLITVTTDDITLFLVADVDLLCEKNIGNFFQIWKHERRPTRRF
jgi:hypothetical protein